MGADTFGKNTSIQQIAETLIFINAVRKIIEDKKNLDQFREMGIGLKFLIYLLASIRYTD